MIMLVKHKNYRIIEFVIIQLFSYSVIFLSLSAEINRF